MPLTFFPFLFLFLSPSNLARIKKEFRVFVVVCLDWEIEKGEIFRENSRVRKFCGGCLETEKVRVESEGNTYNLIDLVLYSFF